MKSLLILNGTNQDISFQLAKGPGTNVNNIGPDGSMVNDLSKTTLYLKPPKQIAEATINQTEPINLEGTFAIAIDGVVIPYSFTPETLLEFNLGLYGVSAKPLLDDNLFAKATYNKSDNSDPMWVEAYYLPEDATGKLYIDWGDGNKEVINVADYSESSYVINLKHTHTTNGEYTIKVYSTTKTVFLALGEITKLVEWGDPTNLRLSLQSANLAEVPSTLPPLMTNLSALFFKAYNFNQDISGWDVSNITDMRNMFGQAWNFNQDLSNWNVSKVTDMAYMFSDSRRFNQDISQWCVGLIPSLPEGFNDSGILTPENTPVWGTCPSDVVIPEADEMYFTTTAGEISYQGLAGDVITLSDNVTLNVTNSSAKTYTVPAGKHKVKLVTERSEGYVGIAGEALIEVHNFPTLSSINNIDFSLNNESPNLVKVPTVLPSNITDLGFMFQGAGGFNQDISMWDTSNVTNMNSMFYYASVFNQPIGSWNTSKVVDMTQMFGNASSFNQPIGNWNVSNVGIMQRMFSQAISFNQDLSQWCVGLVDTLPNSFNTNGVISGNYLPKWGTCPRGENQT